MIQDFQICLSQSRPNFKLPSYCYDWSYFYSLIFRKVHLSSPHHFICPIKNCKNIQKNFDFIELINDNENNLYLINLCTECHNKIKKENLIINDFNSLLKIEDNLINKAKILQKKYVSLGAIDPDL